MAFLFLILNIYTFFFFFNSNNEDINTMKKPIWNHAANNNYFTCEILHCIPDKARFTREAFLEVLK